LIVTGAALFLAACPALTPVDGAPGDAAVAPISSREAQARNAEGKRLYRDGHFAEARARYAGALASDPGFLAAALNSACALARQERFDEAAAEAAALVRRAFIPWGREVLEAADLAPLHARPQMAMVRAALAEGAASWGASLAGSLFFVARTRPPVRLAGQGVLMLGLAQEIHAYDPATGRYRQVTADDGRVLAFARSDDGRTLFYLRGDKLVRDGGRAALRGLAVRRLDVPTMSLGAPLPIEGDLSAVDLAVGTGGQALLRVVSGDGASHGYRVAAALVPAPFLATGPVVHLTADAGVASTRVTMAGACRLRAADERGGDLPAVRVSGAAGRLTLSARFGAGLAGLPFPSDR
jgi:hypothetical protein